MPSVTRFPTQKRDRLWPLDEMETMLVALLVCPYVAFILGWYARGGCQ